jgi:thiamine transporter ThiT
MAGFGSIFSKPTLKSVGFAVVGLAGTPMLTGFIQRYLPASLTGNKWANYAVKGASAYGLSLVASKVAGKDAGRAVLIGGLAYVTLGIITDFFPTLLGTSAGTGRYLNAQPLLAGMREYPFRGTAGPITAGAPSRLDPANRF